MNTIAAILASTSLLVITGCSFSSAAPASAEQTAQLPSPEQTFPVKDAFPTGDVSLLAKTNLFIFWKLDNGKVNPDDVAAVVSLSQDIDQNEDKQFTDSQTNTALLNQYFIPAGLDPTAVEAAEAPIQAQATDPTYPDPAAGELLQLINDPDTSAETAQAAFIAQEHSIAQQLTKLDEANPTDVTADNQVVADTARITEDTAELNEELAKPVAQQDAKKIAALKQDKVTLRSQIATLNGTSGYSAYKLRKGALQKEVAGLYTLAPVVTPALKSVWDLWLKNDQELSAIVIQCSDDITKIIGGTLANGSIAPGHVMPVIGSNSPELTIHFEPSGQIDMKIDQWFPPVGWESPDGSDTNDAPIFTTDDGSIRDVSYTPLGGVFQFTVVTRWATYGFKIARTRYNAPDTLAQKTQHYQGEINLYSDDASQAMRGVAVLDEDSE